MRAPLYKRFQEVVAQNGNGETIPVHIIAVHKVYTHCDNFGNIPPKAESFPDFFFDTIPHPYEVKGNVLIVDVAEYRMPVWEGFIAVYITPRRFLHTGYAYRVVAEPYGPNIVLDESQIFLPINNALNHETQGHSYHPTKLLS